MACKSTAGLMSICLQIEMNDHTASLGMMYGQLSNPPVILGSPGWNYRYKPVATQISQDVLLLVKIVSHIGDRTCAASRNMSSKQHPLNRVTREPR